MIKRALPLILFLALAVVLAKGLTRDPRLLPSEMINRPFPEFELSDLYDAQKTITRADILGQVTLVNVFGSWCTACVQEHPKLMELTNENKVFILGVDWRDTRERGMRWLAHYGNPYAKTVFDADSLLAIDLGITGAPESFLVDKTGNIRYKHVGIITDEVWDEILAPMVKTFEAEP